MAGEWRWSVGTGPTKVTAMEMPHRKHTLYLRWRANHNWAVESLGIPARTAGGRIIATALKAAQRAARAKHRALEAAAAAASAPAAPRYRRKQGRGGYPCRTVAYAPCRCNTDTVSGVSDATWLRPLPAGTLRWTPLAGA